MEMDTGKRAASLLSLVLCFIAFSAHAAPSKAPYTRAVKAGEFLVDPPTLINLGFEWAISGDDNRNAKVEVSYRKKGAAEWRKAMPLMRLQRERVFWGNPKADDHIIDVELPNMFAGSILDLEPNTAYEAKFVLSDPDGVTGEATHVVTVRTRAEPAPATGGHVYHVYPPNWKGPKEANSFVGLSCAYNYHCAGGDESMADRPRVQPGDVILMHAGVYESLYDWYARNSSTRPVEGTYYLLASGTAEKPIVIKAAGDGEVIFDGRGNFNLFNLEHANCTYFEGITFRHTEIAILAGVQFIAGSSGLTVKHCRFEDINVGIVSSCSGSRDFYIADNYFIGRDDPKHLQGWNGDFWLQFNGVDGQEFPAKLKSYTAVRVYGSGYNNYMTNFHDNAFEIDGSMHNIRVMRNLMINSASQPFCNQPWIGGPVYWIRNIAFNAPFGAARMSAGAPGVMFLNNTISTEFAANASANLHMFNNLILGQNAMPAIFSVNTFTSYSESDYNGFRPNADMKYSFEWNAPATGLLQDYRDLIGATNPRLNDTSGEKALVTHRFQTLQAYSAETHNDQHSVLVDYDAFESVKHLDARDPRTVQLLYKAEDFDFRLKPGSAPVDKGVMIPNVTDAYTRTAPDLGALEVGSPVPHYGPRPDTPEKK
jgi:hypothetical protein